MLDRLFSFRRMCLLSVFIALAPGSPAAAQPTAAPVVPGYLATSGCPSGQTTCFVQFGSVVPVSPTAPSATPVAGAAVAVATGTTAVTAVNANAKGCIIVNPLTATDEGIGAVEPLYVNPATTATTAGNGTTAALAPGQSWVCIPSSTVAVSINATTSGHKATVIAW